jgi:hypothetical protein
MKQIKVLVLVGLILVLFQANLFSVISSRVKGLVTDKDTGMPIEGAIVRAIAFPKNLEDFYLEGKTDQNGHFEFGIDNIEKEYFLECKKEEYIPFLPNYYYEQGLECYALDVLRKFFNVFKLEKGESKHLNIELERGGTLKIRILAKDNSGISPYEGVIVELNRKRVESDSTLFPPQLCKFDLGFSANSGAFTDKNGEFTFANLEPFIYNIKILFMDLPQSELKNVEVKKCEIKSVEYIKDLTDPTGIKGTIRFNNSIPIYARIRFEVIENGEATSFYLGNYKNYKDGKYSCLMLPAGKYHMFVGGKGTNGIDYNKEFDIEIISGKTMILNVNLNDGDKYEE